MAGSPQWPLQTAVGADLQACLRLIGETRGRQSPEKVIRKEFFLKAIKPRSSPAASKAVEAAFFWQAYSGSFGQEGIIREWVARTESPLLDALSLVTVFVKLSP